MLGKEHPEISTSMNNLSFVLEKQAKYEAAEEMHQQVLTLRERILGKEHPDILISIYFLASLLHRQKQYDEASVLYQRACAGLEKVLGSHHPNTVGCFQHYSIHARGNGISFSITA